MNDDEVLQHGGGIKNMPLIFAMYDTEFFYCHRRHFINLIQYCLNPQHNFNPTTSLHTYWSLCAQSTKSAKPSGRGICQVGQTPGARQGWGGCRPVRGACSDPRVQGPGGGGLQSYSWRMRPTSMGSMDRLDPGRHDGTRALTTRFTT